MGWHARQRWFADKETAADMVTQLLLKPDRLQSLLQTLYILLGGTPGRASPVVVKGGAAFSLYMTREVAFHADKLPACLCSFAQAADLDFSSIKEPKDLVETGAAALPWLAEASADIWPHWQEWNPQWDLRRDAKWGESFYGCHRSDITQKATPDAELPIKLSLHAGMSNPATGEDFKLLRMGAAI